MDAPDYSQYALDDLYDARRNIRTEQHPERAAELDRVIRERLSDRSEPAKRTTSNPTKLSLSRRAIAAFLLVSGAFSSASLLDNVNPSAGLPGYIAVGIATIAFGGMLLGGVLMWRRRRLGLRIGAAALAIQLPICQIDRITYLLGYAPTFELQFWPLLGFSFTTGIRTELWWHPAPQPLYLGLNFGAAFVFSVIVGFLSREKVARERLTRAGNAG